MRVNFEIVETPTRITTVYNCDADGIAFVIDKFYKDWADAGWEGKVTENVNNGDTFTATCVRNRFNNNWTYECVRNEDGSVTVIGPVS